MTVVEAARTFINVRWKHQGRTNHGIDCVGLVVLSAHLAGRPVVDVTDYSRDANGAELLGHFDARFDRTASPETGDILILRETVFPIHVAILTDKQGQAYMIHAYAPSRRVLEEPYSKQWRDKTETAFTWRAV